MEPWVIVVIALGTLGVLSLIPAAIKWHAEITIAWFNLRRLELDRPIDQYTRLLSEATTKYAQHKYQIAQPKAADAARNSETVRVGGNLIGNLLK